MMRPVCTFSRFLPFMTSYLQEARRTLVLAGPIMVGQLSQMLMGVTDAIMIGHVGKVPLAASAFAGSIFGLFFVIGIGLLVPVSVMISRAHGGGDEAEAAEWMGHGAVLSLGAGIISTLLMIALGMQLHRFGQPAEVLAAVNPYFQLIAVSLVPTLMFQVQRQFAEALERPMVPMVFMLIGVLLNIFLNWVLIYGNLGAPAMGLTGAGWATLISRTVGMVVIFYWVSRARDFRAAWPAKWFRRYSWPRFRELLQLGVPIAMSMTFEGGAFGAAAIMMGWLGSTPLAAHQIAISCAAFTFMIPLGLSMAVSIRVGRAVGGGRLDAVRPIGFSAQIISAVIMGAFALLFVFAGEQLARGFVDERDVVLLAAEFLVVAGIFQLADGAQVVGAASLRGLKDVKLPTILTALAYWGFALPLGYWLGLHTDMGAPGIWVGLAGGLIFAAFALIGRFTVLTRPARLVED